MTSPFKHKLDTLPHLKKPCEQCPWRLLNQGKKHAFGFYTIQNLRRLWNQIRKGDGVQSCHLTDPNHPDHIAVGAKESSEPRECPGSVIVVLKEFRKMSNSTGEINEETLAAYKMKRKRQGLTKDGIRWWLVQRLHMGGVPIVGGPKLPDVDGTDPDINLPERLRDG